MCKILSTTPATGQRALMRNRGHIMGLNPGLQLTTREDGQHGRGILRREMGLLRLTEDELEYTRRGHYAVS